MAHHHSTFEHEGVDLTMPCCNRNFMMAIQGHNWMVRQGKDITCPYCGLASPSLHVQTIAERKKKERQKEEMKARKHHNQIKRGKTYTFLKRLAKKLGIRFGEIKERIMKCLDCGADLEKGKGDHSYLESGLDNVKLIGITNYTCLKCGEQEWKIQSMEVLHRLIGCILSVKQDKLTNNEAKFIMKYFGYTEEKFASLLNMWEVKPGGEGDKPMNFIFLEEKHVWQLK